MGKNWWLITLTVVVIALVVSVGLLYYKIIAGQLIFEFGSVDSYLIILIGIATITFTFSAISIWASFLTNIQSQKEDLNKFGTEIKDARTRFENDLNIMKNVILEEYQSSKDDLKKDFDSQIKKIKEDGFSDLQSKIDLLLLISEGTTIGRKRELLARMDNEFTGMSPDFTTTTISIPPLILETLENYFLHFTHSKDIEEKFKNKLQELLDKWGCKFPLPENNEEAKAEQQPNRNSDDKKTKTTKVKKNGK